MPDSIRVGVITDTDGAHLAEYFTSLAATPEVEKIAVADPSGKCREIATKLLGDKLASFHDDHSKMLREFNPKLALVTLEPRNTPRSIGLALLSGCHILT